MAADTRHTDGQSATTLDARGLACPMPVLKAKKAIRRIAVGDGLTVLATDPGARADFETFCEVTGHGLEGIDEHDGVLTIRLRRAK